MPSRRDGFVDKLPGNLHLSQRRNICRGVSRRQTQWAGDTPYRHHGEYVGEFRDGWASGRAYAYPDGRRYVGEWRNGDFNGREVRTYPDGRKEDGEWSGGELVKSAEENSPLLDAPRKPPAAIVDASEINQSRPVVLIGSEIFGGVAPLLMLFLVIGAVIAAIFGLKAKPRSAAPSIAVRGRVAEADEQSKIIEARRALLEAVEDFAVSDTKLLELRASARQIWRNSEPGMQCRNQARRDSHGFPRFIHERSPLRCSRAPRTR